LTDDTFRSSPARFSSGDLVIAAKDLRQDGTYPDPAFAVGDVIVEQGTPGQVVDVGVYLNEHIVYAVAFTGLRLVGCLEREVSPLPVDESDGEHVDDLPAPAVHP
jgi:nitrogen fixation protein NifZ